MSWCSARPKRGAGARCEGTGSGGARSAPAGWPYPSDDLMGHVFVEIKLDGLLAPS